MKKKFNISHKIVPDKDNYDIKRKSDLLIMLLTKGAKRYLQSCSNNDQHLELIETSSEECPK